MASERYIKAVIYAAVLVWTVVLYVNHDAIHSSWLQPLSTVITVVLYAVMAFDLWLWKIPLLHGWFVKRPVIEGIWKVAIRSDWKDPSTDAPTPPIEGYMVVRQTFSTISMRLMTAESSSELVGTEIVCAVDGLYCVSGVYRNEPRYQDRGHSELHFGAVWLQVIDKPTQMLQGHYWTDRNTAGEMHLTDRQRTKFQDFQSAQAHYAK